MSAMQPVVETPEPEADPKTLRPVQVPILGHPFKTKPPEGYGIVYRILSPSGKSYIGQTTKSVLDRVREHRHVKRRRSNIRKAIDKYGKENMQYFVLGMFELDDLNTAEKWYIEHFQSHGRGGYNIDGGGIGSYNRFVSAETRAKISKIHKGMKMPQSGIEKMRASKIGVKQHPATVKKRAAALVGRPRPADVRARISAAHMGKQLSDTHLARIREQGIRRRGSKQSPETHLRKIEGQRIRREKEASEGGQVRSLEARANIKAGRAFAKRLREEKLLLDLPTVS